MTAKEFDELLSGQNEVESMEVTESLEEKISTIDDFITNLEKGLKEQADSTKALLDQILNIPAEVEESQKEELIKNSRELKEYAYEIYSFCVKTREAYNNKKTEFKTKEDLNSYMAAEFLPAIDKIQKMSGGGSE